MSSAVQFFTIPQFSGHAPAIRCVVCKRVADRVVAERDHGVLRVTINCHGNTAIEEFAIEKIDAE